ncbi:MAG: long-chain-acyl-CoA synthetase [Proteobacteria bacterium]|nr:long-chain-acyl-CoA synthetase [Pseudomonadota bacterium]
MAQIETNKITFGEFIPGLKQFFKLLPSTTKARKEFEKIERTTFVSMGSYIEEHAEKIPHKTALLFESERYTYREFNERCNQVANFFLSSGAKKGDVVTVIMENNPFLLFTIVGLSKIGAVVSLVNPVLRGSVLEHCVTIAHTRFYIIDEDRINAFEEIRARLSLSPSVKLFILSTRKNASTKTGYIDLIDQLKNVPVANPATTKTIKPQDLLCYIFTSGTTGKPKAAAIDHHRWISGKYAFGSVMELTPEDTIYIPLPFFHGTALFVAWGAAIHGGAAILIRRRFSASQFWVDVKKYHATAFAYIGELCRYLYNQPSCPEEKDHAIQKIIGNGLRTDIWKSFKKRFQIPYIFEFYASSEGNITFLNLMNLDCTIGIGLTPYAIAQYNVEQDKLIKNKKGFTQKIRKNEAGLLLGEITDKSRFGGYTSEEATEQKIFRDVFKKGDAWFNTGDLVKKIGFGHAQFVDRIGDTFRWKGENVSTVEVEEVIDSIDMVNESSVYGVQIPGTEGRAGMASIITDINPESFDFLNFTRQLRRLLPSFAVPVFIRFQKEFETTATMKRIKSKLKQTGFNPGEVKDPLYVLFPGTPEYVRLTQSLYSEIVNGNIQF